MSNEEEIREEIRNRVLEQNDRAERMEEADAEREALSEITSLSRDEVDRIASDVRREIASKSSFKKNVLIYAVCIFLFAAAAGGIFITLKYNRMVVLDEEVKKRWSQVENVYQRRLDLIPNLVETVKSYASHEKETLRMVAEAQAKSGEILGLSRDILNDSEGLTKFQDVQTELTGALRQVMVVMGNYPELKSDQNFLALQAQLEGSENRIAVERKRFNEAVVNYNGYIKRFPQVMLAGMFGFSGKKYFKAEKGAEKAPKVKFD